jgi:hypothetical protein
MLGGNVMYLLDLRSLAKISGIAAAGAPIVAGIIADQLGLPSVMYLSMIVALFAIGPVVVGGRK